MERKKITFDSFIRGSIGCVLVVGILMLVERLSGVLLPFFIAWLIAYMVYPLVKFFQYKLRLKSRIVSIFCALFLITLVGVSLFYLLVPPMVSEIGRMNDLLVTYLTNGAGNNVPKNLSEFIHENIDLQALNRILSEENILAAIKDTVPRVWALLAESLNILFSILASFIILLYVIFILLDYEVIAEGWLHLLPNKYRTFASNLVHDVQDGMNRYFRGQALVAFCVGILFSIGFLIIDFPMAIALGLFIGALNMVPYLQIIGFLKDLKMEQTGYSTANLSGSVRYLTLYVSTGKVAASDLEVMSAEVNAQSKAEVSLWITDRFVGKTTTNARISYKGDPKIVRGGAKFMGGEINRVE